MLTSFSLLLTGSKSAAKLKQSLFYNSILYDFKRTQMCTHFHIYTDMAKMRNWIYLTKDTQKKCSDSKLIFIWRITECVQLPPNNSMCYYVAVHVELLYVHISILHLYLTWIVWCCNEWTSKSQSIKRRQLSNSFSKSRQRRKASNQHNGQWHFYLMRVEKSSKRGRESTMERVECANGTGRWCYLNAFIMNEISF